VEPDDVVRSLDFNEPRSGPNDILIRVLMQLRIEICVNARVEQTLTELARIDGDDLGQRSQGMIR
jgi:hypothetical protein